MTVLRYFDKPEYEEAQKKAEEFSQSQGKLTRRSASMWLRGEEGERSKQEIDEVSTKTYEAKKRYLVGDEVIERTKEKISNHAKGTGKAFRREMPHGARFAPTPDMEPKLLEKYPHLGVCGFGEIPVRLNGRDVTVALYVANFNATISTDPDEDFFKITKPDYAEMYFAVAWRKVGDDKYEVAADLGHNGVMFQTTDKSKAFDNSVYLSTGRKVSEWQRRIKEANEKLLQANVRAAGGFAI